VKTYYVELKTDKGYMIIWVSDRLKEARDILIESKSYKTSVVMRNDDVFQYRLVYKDGKVKRIYNNKEYV